MASVKAYVNVMRTAQRAIAVKYGSSLQDKRIQVAVASCLALQAVLVKLLVDKGVVTDVELQNALDAAMADAYDDEPN